MEELSQLFSSKEFWSVAGSVAGVLSLLFVVRTFMQRKDSVIASNAAKRVEELATEFAELSNQTLYSLDRLSLKGQSGSQDDNEGKELTTSINNALWEIRAKASNLVELPELNNPNGIELREAAETVYDSFQAITSNRGGLTSPVKSALENFKNAQRSFVERLLKNVA